MCGETVSILQSILAVVFCGASIKIMDDFLDQELDILQGKETLSQKLGQGSLPYSLLFLLLAMSFDNSLSGSLFLSSYIVGMSKDIKLFLPSHLPSYGEMLIAFLLGNFLFGFSSMFTSLLLICLIQLLDDLYDYYKEKEITRYNLVIRLGKTECFLSSILLTMVLLFLSWQKLFLVLAVTPLIICLMEKRYTREEQNKMLIAIFIFFCLSTFLFGYSVGKKCGKIQGRQAGALLKPIELRQESLEKGHCPICGTCSSEKHCI